MAVSIVSIELMSNIMCASIWTQLYVHVYRISRNVCTISQQIWHRSRSLHHFTPNFDLLSNDITFHLHPRVRFLSNPNFSSPRVPSFDTSPPGIQFPFDQNNRESIQLSEFRYVTSPVLVANNPDAFTNDGRGKKGIHFRTNLLQKTFPTNFSRLSPIFSKKCGLDGKLTMRLGGDIFVEIFYEFYIKSRVCVYLSTIKKIWKIV